MYQHFTTVRVVWLLLGGVAVYLSNMWVPNLRQNVMQLLAPRHAAGPGDRQRANGQPQQVARLLLARMQVRRLSSSVLPKQAFIVACTYFDIQDCRFTT